MRSFIIGTAGHIDHGKTTLVGALTGIDTDRLAEEKQRGISIDLGFAPLYLPSGIEAGIVDVPGHERFVKNMVAGASGIDLLLLVVAADDGVMAQTLEHLAIAELLGVGVAVVALTKADKVDAEQVSGVAAQISEVLGKGSFAGSPIVPVSAVSKTGLDDLVEAIEERAHGVADRSLDFPVRLPIDRSFILPGAGRIVTGTLWSGVLTTGTDLELQPTGEACRLRRIEVYGQEVTKALPGQRVAVNVVVSGRPPERGDFLVPPATFALAAELIAKVQVLPQSPRALKRRARVRLFHGTGETKARIIPLGVDEIRPGESAFARLLPVDPLPAVFRDHFILRTLSPITTIAGGVILEARARITPGEIDLDRLEALAVGDDASIVRATLQRQLLPLTVEDLADAAQIGREAAKKAVETLVADEELSTLRAWRRTYYLSVDQLASATRSVEKHISEYHEGHPYEYGPAKDAVRNALWPDLSSSQADILFEHCANLGLVSTKEGKLAQVGRTEGGAAQAREAELGRVLRGFAPPAASKLAVEIDLDPADVRHLLARLESTGQIIAISSDIYFMAESVEEARDILTEYILEAGEITVSRFKELLGTTRKYAVPLLEYFDKQNITRRAGDVRTLIDPRPP